jgi:SAM-dependent methyltransferase
MIEIPRIATNLEPVDDGFWIARNRSSVSYPADGHQSCFQIEDGSFWFRHRNRCIRQVLANFPPGGAVFDIGAGNGYVALGMQQSGIDVVALEVGVEGARNAWSRSVRPVICASLEDCGFREASIPAAGLFDVVEHIEDDAGFLRSLRSLLVPEARLYITVPAFTALWSDEDVRAGHFRRYTLARLGALLESTGFEVEYDTYFFVPLPIPIFLFRSLPNRLGMHHEKRARDRQREHNPKLGIGGRLFERALDAEVKAIEARRRLRVGGSCLVVARSRR